MQIKNYFKAQMPILALTALAIALTSCGSYQSVGEDNDGIYSSSKEPVEYTENVAQNSNKSYYENYFQEKSGEYDYMTEESAVFTDIDSYEGNYVEQDTTEQKSNAGWGEDNNDVVINVYGGYGGGFGYFNHGWNSAWRWQNGFGYSPWNAGWGWGFGGLYDPFWCSPYYGYGYGYGYGGYYNSPYWNNYGYYNNYYGRNRVAYHNSRRGSNINRLNTLGSRRSNIINRPTTTRPRVRNTTSTPRPRVSTTPRSSTSTATQPRPRSTNSISTKPKRKSTTTTTPRPRRTNTNSTPRPRRTNTSSAPRTSRNNTFSRPSRSSSSSRSSAPSRRRG